MDILPGAVPLMGMSVNAGQAHTASGGLATRTVVAQHGPHPARKLGLVTALVTETGGEPAERAGTDREDGQTFPEVEQHQDA
jgi:hypothetical protein